MRRSGRTTSMLDEAIELAKEGQRALVVAHSWDFVSDYIAPYLIEQGGIPKFQSQQIMFGEGAIYLISAHSFLQGIRGRHVDKYFVDHAVYETVPYRQRVGLYEALQTLVLK